MLPPIRENSSGEKPAPSVLKMAWQVVVALWFSSLDSEGVGPGFTTSECPARLEMGTCSDVPGNSWEKTRGDQAPAAMTRRVQGTSVSVEDVVSPILTDESSSRRSV